MPVPAVAAAAAKAAAKKAAKKAADSELAAKGNRAAKKWLKIQVLAVVILWFGLIGVVLSSFAGISSPAAATCGAGQSVPSSADLDPALLGAINALKPLYDQVAVEKNVSWALLAGIDYREDGNDPNASMLSGEPLGSANPDNPGVVTSTKLDSVEKGADHLRDMVASVYGVGLNATSSGDDIKNTAIAYNRGFIYQRANAPADSSPYVMNNYDGAHQAMVFPPVPGEPLAGMTDTRPGAYTIFARLGGATAGSSCAGLSSNDLVAIAQSQLGHAEEPLGCNCGASIQPYLGSSSSEQWCADFVSWVYMTAHRPFTGGADGGWRLAGVAGLREWFSTQPGQAFYLRGGGDLPQPGDVIIFAGDEHTGLVETADALTINTIEGNRSDSVSRGSYDMNDGSIVGWGRMMTATVTPAA